MGDCWKTQTAIKEGLRTLDKERLEKSFQEYLSDVPCDKKNLGRRYLTKKCEYSGDPAYGVVEFTCADDIGKFKVTIRI